MCLRRSIPYFSFPLPLFIQFYTFPAFLPSVQCLSRTYLPMFDHSSTKFSSPLNILFIISNITIIFSDVMRLFQHLLPHLFAFITVPFLFSHVHGAFTFPEVLHQPFLSALPNRNSLFIASLHLSSLISKLHLIPSFLPHFLSIFPRNLLLLQFTRNIASPYFSLQTAVFILTT